jgi:hypothetical protein
MQTQIKEPICGDLYTFSQEQALQLNRLISKTLGEQNLRDLEEIREIILMEENRALELDQVLARVISHYKEVINI